MLSFFELMAFYISLSFLKILSFFRLLSVMGLLFIVIYRFDVVYNFIVVSCCSSFSSFVSSSYGCFYFVLTSLYTPLSFLVGKVIVVLIFSSRLTVIHSILPLFFFFLKLGKAILTLYNLIWNLMDTLI